MSDLLFDTPPWVLGVLAVMGITLFIVGNQRLDKGLRNVGIGAFALGVALFLTSWFVDTPREKCVRRSRELVAAVAGRDWNKLSTLIAPQFKLSIAGGGAVYAGKDEMIEACKEGVDRYGLKSAKVLSIEGSNTGDYIKVNLAIYSEQDFTMGYPLQSGWEFDWQQENGAWELTEVTALQVGGRSGGQIRGDFPRGK